MAQQRDHAVQDARGHLAVAPDRVEDLVTRDDAAGAPDQQQEHGKRLRFQRYLCAVDPQATAGNVDLDFAEPNPVCSVDGISHPGGHRIVEES
jgi:hypothetical protein